MPLFTLVKTKDAEQLMKTDGDYTSMSSKREDHKDVSLYNYEYAFSTAVTGATAVASTPEHSLGVELPVTVDVLRSVLVMHQAAKNIRTVVFTFNSTFMLERDSNLLQSLIKAIRDAGIQNIFHYPNHCFPEMRGVKNGVSASVALALDKVLPRYGVAAVKQASLLAAVGLNSAAAAGATTAAAAGESAVVAGMGKSSGQ